MTEATSTVTEDPFDLAFAEVALAAEKSSTHTAEEVAAAAKAADDAAAAAAKAAEGKTPEQIAQEEAAAKAAADAVTAKAAADAAEAEANKGKTPEQIASEKAAAEAVAAAKATADAKAAADAKVVSDAAAAQAAADAATATAAATAKAAADKKAADDAFQASVKPYEPTEEEKTALATFKKDFPNEYAAMEARLKSVDQNINARVAAAVKDVLEKIDPRLVAVESTTTVSAADAHFRALRQAHVDYDVVIPKVADWIKTQPAYLQPTMQAIYAGGSTAEVLGLVADYKKATGTTGAPDAAAVAAAAAAAVKVAADAAAKKKAAEDAAAGLPVGSRRTTTEPRGKADQNDYDGAFAEVAAAYTK